MKFDMKKQFPFSPENLNNIIELQSDMKKCFFLQQTLNKYARLERQQTLKSGLWKRLELPEIGCVKAKNFSEIVIVTMELVFKLRARSFCT